MYKFTNADLRITNMAEGYNHVAQTSVLYFHIIISLVLGFLLKGIFIQYKVESICENEISLHSSGSVSQK